MAAEPRWVTLDDVFATHDEQLARFGGLPGVRDAGLIESAVARPIQMYLLGGVDDVLALAVGLGIGIAQNHGFADGNKRTGMVAMLTFLRQNGYRLEMPDDTLLGRMMEAVLTHDMTEDAFADHIADYVVDDD